MFYLKTKNYGLESFLKPHHEVACNTKIKHYKNGQKNITYASDKVFLPEGWENAGRYDENGNHILEFLNSRDYSKSDNPETRLDSLKRAKDFIFDYVLNNDFEFFFTGTLDPKQIDNKDPKEVMKKITKWLQNQTARNDLQYLLVAEYHKKGGIHFHGVFKGNVKIVSSGTRKYKGYKKPIKDETALRIGLDISEGHEVFNLPSWKFGFTTAIKCYGEKTAIAFYITKYLTKDANKIFGRFYWHSRGIEKPVITYENSDFNAVDSFEFHGFKYEFKG